MAALITKVFNTAPERKFLHFLKNFSRNGSIVGCISIVTKVSFVGFILFRYIAILSAMTITGDLSK